MNYLNDKFKAAGSSIKSGVNFAAREIKADLKALARPNPAKTAFMMGQERPNVKQDMFISPANKMNLTGDIAVEKNIAARDMNAFAM